MECSKYVTAANVSCATRHTDNRRNRLIEIEKTQLNAEYGGEQIARNKIREKLNQLGFNSHFSVIEWHDSERLVSQQPGATYLGRK
ncbi:hypothetical protein LRP52_23955 [Photobacterium sp. ZSDE20]|uniref:Uncharacterized protein n=1 Tax=Photobacterium pectinilyticum TaxID=2906793 RepID=A0ABT1N0Y1_9GAMM|nr:hypothetical protein [Photobacterium sp. ZSDE20]MCQ1058388.1 hypothetical protein [Photobacterium sp. ZSDE20]MDD1825249.1 hypothetical protein [Photobacterium sp. ZSDE20]